MLVTLLKAVTLVSIIVLANIMTSLGLFEKVRDFDTISKTVFYLTLPCAIISNLNGLKLSPYLLFISVIGLLCNILYLAMSYFLGRNRHEKSFLMLNMNGYNIGNFFMPFISYFFSEFAILAVSLFDAGSAFMVLGGNYGVAKSIGQSDSKIDLVFIGRTMLSSPSVVVYILMISLSLLSLQLPTFIIDITTIIGNANTFLSMFMIGLALELNLDRSHYQLISRALVGRYLVASILSVMLYYLLPFNLEVRQTLAILVFAPVSGVATLYTRMLGENFELSAVINSLSIIISIVIMSTLLVLWG